MPERSERNGYKDDKIRSESTSGGGYTGLSESILKGGGVVFGAGFENHQDYYVCHMAVESTNELRKFRNSKYVQSDMRDCYEKCKDALLSGRSVLFSGTPCQIAGLKSFLGKEYERLYTVDVVCRAVPSPKVFRKYLSYQRKKIGFEISDIRFRDKYYGYDYSTLSIYPQNTNKYAYHKGIESDLYLRIFFSGICDRPSCEKCPFRRYHMSDITIWDCFDVRSIAPEMDDNKGTSRMAINTHKGDVLFKDSSDKFRFKAYIPDLSKKEVAYSEHKESRMEFFEDIDCLEEEEFFNKYFPETAKVKILGGLRQFTYKIGVYRKLKIIWNMIKNR